MIGFIRRHLLMLVLTGGVLILISWGVGSSESFQECVKQYPSNNDKNQFGHISAFFSNTICFVSSNRELIDTLSTFLLVVVTLGLVWAASDQSSTTKKQLRAYIGMDEMKVSDHRKIEPVGDRLEAKVLLKNFGATPATKLTHAFGMAIKRGPLPKEAFAKPKWSEEQIAQPTQEVICLIRDRSVFDAAEWLHIRQGLTDFNIYVYGIIRYEDIFGYRHYTKFCFKVEYRDGPNNPPGWDWYQNHNKTDDQKEYLSEIAMRLLRTPFMWNGMVGSILSISKS